MLKRLLKLVRGYGNVYEFTWRGHLTGWTGIEILHQHGNEYSHMISG